MNPRAAFIIEKLGLKPHPEGGYFKEIYRSNDIIPHSALPKGFGGDRNFCTSIYFLLEGKDFSAFHRIQSDELWHFHEGCDVNIYELGKEGLVTHRLGGDFNRTSGYQCVINAGNWFASRPNEPDSYVLTGCTVSPGFDFADFEMAERTKLVSEFPACGALIKDLTR